MPKSSCCLEPGTAGTATAYKPELLSATDYFPFGMQMPERVVVNGEGYRYGFNTQEKEDEISGSAGTHYSAEFWMYDTRTARRWNLDPVDQISISNYACLFNNPLNVTDELGDTGFKLNKDGTTTELAVSEDRNDGGDEFDVLYKTDDENNLLTDNPFKLDKNVMSSKKTNSGQGTDGKNYTFDMYTVTGDERSAEMFRFVAENSNVEWSQTLIGTQQNQKSILSTSRDKDTEAGQGYIFARGWTIRGHNHSHPYSNIPSRSDKSWAEKLNKKFPNAKLNIIHKGTYYLYDEKGLVFDESMFDFPEIKVISKPATKTGE
jgi:hypothetical protein